MYEGGESAKEGHSRFWAYETTYNNESLFRYYVVLVEHHPEARRVRSLGLYRRIGRGRYVQFERVLALLAIHAVVRPKRGKLGETDLQNKDRRLRIFLAGAFDVSAEMIRMQAATGPRKGPSRASKLRVTGQRSEFDARSSVSLLRGHSLSPPRSPKVSLLLHRSAARLAHAAISYGIADFAGQFCKIGSSDAWVVEREVRTKVVNLPVAIGDACIQPTSLSPAQGSPARVKGVSTFLPAFDMA